MRIIVIALFLAACQGHAAQPDTIRWDDGDSGKLGELRFRLADVDAPEPRSMKSPVGPARCEKEIRAGIAAKQFVIDLTSSGEITFEWNGETDRLNRKVGDIKVSGQSVSEAGLREGHLKRWEHDGSRQLMPKPDWC